MSLFKSRKDKNLILVILVIIFMSIIAWQWVVSDPFSNIKTENNALTEIEESSKNELDDLRDSIAKGAEETKIIKDEIDKQLKQERLIEEAKKYLENKESDKLLIPDNKEDCKVKGGEWQIWGEATDEACNLFTQDADKECADSSQCEAYCVIDLPEIVMKDLPIETSGKCTARTVWPGCYSLVEEGFVYGVVCN